MTSTTPVNPEPIKWDPSTMTSLPLSAVMSAAYNASDSVTLTIYDTEQNVKKTFTAQQLIGASATTVTNTWDGSLDTGTDKAPKGIYLFKWVASNSSIGDSDTDKSKYVSITGTDSRVTDFNKTTEITTFTDKCLLIDSCTPISNALTCQVRPYDPDINPLTAYVQMGVTTNAPNSVSPVWNDGTVQFKLPKPGIYIHLFSAQDNHALQDRGHRSQWALQKNDEKEHPLAVAFDFQDYPQPPPNSGLPRGPEKTTPYAEETAAKLGKLIDGSSYKAEHYTGKTVQDAFEMMKKAAIITVFGHGGPSFLRSGQTFWDHTQKKWSYLVGNSWAYEWLSFEPDKVHPRVPATDYIWIDDPTIPGGNTTFKSVLLAVFLGCNTGNCGDGALDNHLTKPWGSPAYSIVARGAKCSIGFQNTIYPDVKDDNDHLIDAGAEKWGTEFWDHIKAGDDVVTAAKTAYRLVDQRRLPLPKIYGLKGDVDGWPTEQLKIHTARYYNP